MSDPIAWLRERLAAVQEGEDRKPREEWSREYLKGLRDAYEATLDFLTTERLVR